ncbi:MAG: protein O-mannosyl-transferase family [Bacteroidota bacterium]
MKRYNLYNLVVGWTTFLVSAVVYLLTIEPTTSFWDCGEFITTAATLQVGHPPGAPVFMVVGRLFTLLGGSPSNAAVMINIMSALASAFTILFLFWSITHLAKKLVATDDEISTGSLITILGAGLVGALGYAFTDTFWFSAVEGEVYAMSSFLTALVFWAILKWENIADEPHANRWLILIAYLIGLSIGVHLLNLLAIPAIVFVYYFRKYEVTTKGIIYALLISVAILGGLMYGVIPGFVKIASWFELLFVNTFGLPFHSGALFYVIALTALMIWAIRYTVIRNLIVWNTVAVALTVIFIGYSSFALIIIRSAAGPPMDQNSPNDTFSLLSYLNREQYGSRPLVYGQYYNSPLDPQNRYTQGSPYYTQRDGKYVITEYRITPNYDDKFKTLFPRMWSSMDPQHAAEYEQWAQIKGRRIRHQNERGETETIVKPTMGENLKFFFRYQVGHMYMRYFMWNFAGRQNDIQSHGGVLNGNWISGINVVDNFRLGDQKNLPESLSGNKARNKYYFLPLIFGLLGIFYQFNKGREGRQGLWIVTLLFIMTGLAIVVYLNQYPLQPRERDYAYAGSFYAFAIWIGLGIPALYEAFRKMIPDSVNASLVTFVGLLAVPVLLLAENYDDHDRSNRYTARDLGANYLKTVANQGIVFTNGDNDTFPLWYNQDVEGVRRDVRVCNLSYLQTDWYISQMKRKMWDSEPLPFSLREEQYTQGTRDLVYLLDDPRIKRETVDLREAVSFVGSEDPATKLRQAGNASYIPKKVISYPIDKEAVIRNNVVRPEDYDKIVDTMYIDLRHKDYLPKDEFMILDLIANNNWERPIYFAITIGSNKFMNLQDYFQLEGFAYRLVPIRKETPSNERINFGSVASDIMYNNLMEEFKWGNMNDPDVYIDENNARMMTNIRNNFNRLAQQLVSEAFETVSTGETQVDMPSPEERIVNEDKIEKAIRVVERGFDLVPTRVVPHEFFSLDMINTLYEAGAIEKAREKAMDAHHAFTDMLGYLFSLNPRFRNSGDVNDEIQKNLFYLQKLERIARAAGDEDTADKAGGSLEEFYNRFLGSI